MLQVKIGLVAMRALVFAFGILGGVRDGLTNCRAWAARVGGEHTASTLLANNMHRLRVLVGENGLRVGIHAHSHATSAYILKSSGEGVLAQRV